LQAPKLRASASMGAAGAFFSVIDGIKM
jgi:hypothetical protein